MNDKVKLRAREIYILKYNGRKNLKDCILEAILDVTSLSKGQMARLFDIVYSDTERLNLDAYIEYLYREMYYDTARQR